VTKAKVVTAGGTSACRNISFAATARVELFELTKFHRDIERRRK
jgi:hypothetical protein